MHPVRIHDPGAVGYRVCRVVGAVDILHAVSLSTVIAAVR